MTMRYIDGFRSSAAAAALASRIRDSAARLQTDGRAVTIMEVCGTHTMAIARHGIRDLLPPNVSLVSGPGCPVCVTPPGYIDTAIALAERGITLATFGDMLHVPGSEATLCDCRAEGGRAEACYSPLDALRIAAERPREEVVFLAVGFETTTAPVVSLVPRAHAAGVENLSILTAFKLVPPALRALLDDPEIRIDAFLCPAHVSAIIGPEAYAPFSGPNGVPCVIAGFEPLDILLGLDGILRQLAGGQSRVENQYSRVVRPGGNPKARAVMDAHLRPTDAEWRGLGVIPHSGLTLRDEWSAFDAERRHGVPVLRGHIDETCRCGDVIKGKIRPPDCPLFGTVCDPDHALGPCMVSAEGACAAHFKYGLLETP